MDSNRNLNQGVKTPFINMQVLSLILKIKGSDYLLVKSGLY